MGYSKSVALLQQRAQDLEGLARGRESIWSCTPGEETQAAYKIREALYIAKYHAAEEYPELAKAHDNFMIAIDGRGKVRAIRKSTFKLEEESTEENEAIDFREENPPGEDLTIHYVRNLLGIIDTVKKTEGFSSLHFPETSLSDDDVLSLAKWIESQGDLLFFYGDNSVTIKQYSQELEALVFTPDDLD